MPVEAGFDVQDAAMQRGFNWLSQALPQLENENSGYYSQGPQATRAYAFYVMARAGRADPRELRSAFHPIGGANSEAVTRWLPSIGRAPIHKIRSSNR